ncbi:PREDICTED: protein NUCLEAR FUSION DEFECTIVE 4-like [Erythranthe guttata]|uniref:protein NUCLEAR FUSION DEFECTIVE 4-like n=1 Tax=Erythranthe guttata TaxID=4155 RepID=UPI00064E0F9E|nr:PREDICTED: protein NUCLEAR FUSION DEFECTIVE 4-like [Erythranthe guttata]|eukprot:XP_012831420.1 PREDICTED: protein NUCLEAR FUSION DEFECTIVE 4-like [Erythranthe guttata]
MVRESRKWMVLVATIWIQAFTGTNLDFSSYSSDMKSALGISQVQLNYLAVASDFGKAFGWCSGVSLLYFPTWFVLFFAAFVGLFGYGLQWLVIHQIISLPYILVLLLSLLSGCSICWFNTVCYVLCIKSFETNRALALSLGVSFNGLSAAIYNLVANSINPNDKKLYLLLNAVIPLITSIVSLPPITTRHLSNEASPSDNHIPTNFYYLTALAVITGLYLLILNPISTNVSIARFVLSGAIFLLVVLPHLVRFDLEGSSVDKETETQSPNDFSDSESNDLFKDRGVVLGDEHSTRVLIRSRDFWLYYVAYLCGGTLGLVYSNNLGQISESLGFHSDVGSLVSLYSACSFFGRLLSTTPEFFRHKIYYARTGWLALALIPTPFAFLLLVFSDSKATLVTATAMIGLSSGFVFSAAVSITSELFGPNRAGVNHNILITNIPIGSLLYSLLAALIYEANIGNSDKIAATRDGSTVCVGRDCYRDTFVWWWLISLLGFVSSSLLFLRTKATYKRMEKHQKHSTQTTLLKSFSSYDES